MPGDTNQDTQGAPPVITAAPVTPVVVPAPNAATPEAQQALAQGQVPPAGTVVAAPVIEAPVAPQIGPTEAAKAAAVTAEPGAATGELEYAPTGDAGMDVALAFVGKLGITPDDPAMIKAGEGDFSFLKAKFAALGDKARGWEQHVALAENSYGAAVKTAQEGAAKITSVVHQVAGGVDAWNTIQAWAAENADDAEKAAINKMLSSDPVQARAAVTLLQNAHNQATGTTVLPANPLSLKQPGATPNVTDANAPLSPKEYVQALNALSRTRGVDAINNGSPEYQALQRRAAAYKR